MISPASSKMIFMCRLQSNAPVSAAAMVRDLANLVPAPAFQPMKIRAPVFDSATPRRHLCTNPHEIKAENSRLQISSKVAVARSPR
jgi:hypothetical protein